MKVIPNNLTATGIGRNKKSFELLLELITHQVQTIEGQLTEKPLTTQSHYTEESQVI